MPPEQKRQFRGIKIFFWYDDVYNSSLIDT